MKGNVAPLKGNPGGILALIPIPNNDEYSMVYLSIFSTMLNSLDAY